MKRGFDRLQRIASLIRQTLAQMLLQEMSDERFRFVTITDVTVSRDMSHAKVYVSVLQDNESDIKDIIVSLNKAAKSIRYNLAKQVDLRVVPELKFVYDESTARGFHLSSLIDAAVKKEKK